MNNIKDLICKTAKEAGYLQLEHLNKIKNIDEKEGLGIVTEVDILSEELIQKRLSKGLPDSTFLSEEMGEKNSGKDYKWIVDPLDGTSNYAHGFPWFCVSIALEKHGEITAGAIYHPYLDELFYAEKGKGSYLNDKKISVSKTKEMKMALLATGFYYQRGAELKESIKRFEKVQQVVLGVRRPGSAALDLAYTACGRFDGFWEKGLLPWDKAAGEIIFKEAGGTLTDYKGGKFSVYNDETLATNGLIHESMIELLII